MDNSPVALVELSNSHDECLYAQIRFLHSAGRRVHLVVSQQLAEERLDPRHGADEVCVIATPRSMFEKLQSARRAAAYLRERDLRQAVLNTCEGRPARDFTLFAPRGTELIGVLHDGGKLIRRSLTQSIISRRVKKYFVLNDYVRDFLLRQGVRQELGAFYPIFFPGVREVPPPANDFLVAVPGPLLQSRRDYYGLLEALTTGKLDPRIRFLLLGSSTVFDGSAFRRLTSQRGQTDRFVFFDGFLDYPELMRSLRRCRLILPLIHPGIEYFESFTRSRISGNFNLAFALQKPLLLHDAFRGIADFEQTAAFYAQPDLIDRLNDLAADPSALLRLERRAAEYPKLRFEQQVKRYLALLQPAAAAHDRQQGAWTPKIRAA